jgi:lipopolysaccharide transport system permease protein
VAGQRVQLIDPSGRTSVRTAIREVLGHRDLLLLLARRDVSVRYKQAVFGFAWAVVQPLVLVAAFTLFLRGNGHVGSGGVAYPVFAMAGMVPWTFFSSAVIGGSQSLVGSSNLISKVYFPRLTIPTAAVLSWFFDLFLAVATLGVVMAVYRVPPSLTILLLPAVVVVALVAVLAVAVWTAALNVAYRDVKHAVPFAVQLWLFATPGIYTASRFHGALGAAVSLNPMTAVVALFRWSVLGTTPASWGAVGASAAVSVLLLGAGLVYFGRVEQYFADLI